MDEAEPTKRYREPSPASSKLVHSLIKSNNNSWCIVYANIFHFEIFHALLVVVASVNYKDLQCLVSSVIT